MSGLARTGLVAVPVAVVATAAVAAVCRAAGVDFEVKGSDESIPVSGVAFVTGVSSVVGVLLAAAFRRWSARPAARFTTSALGLTAVSLVPPVLAAADAGTAAALVVLHLVAAAVVVPALARALRADARA